MIFRKSTVPEKTFRNRTQQSYERRMNESVHLGAWFKILNQQVTGSKFTTGKNEAKKVIICNM